MNLYYALTKLPTLYSQSAMNRELRADYPHKTTAQLFDFIKNDTVTAADGWS